jgi:hypothetical protein
VGADVIGFGRSGLIAATSSIALLAACLTVSPDRAQAQWWTAAPADFEDCADRIEKSSLTGEMRASAQSDCESKFAGRRKPGGGYTYYDFMQDRSFDIAGPNPTSAEQRLIDEQYAIYLQHQRRNIILAAFARKQTEPLQSSVAESDFRDQTANTTIGSGPPVTLPRPRPKPRIAKGADCVNEPLACGWSKLSSGLKDLKDALFGSPAPAKTKRT